MKKDKEGILKRFLRFLVSKGRKCRIIAYPVVCLTVAVLAVYHTFRRILGENSYRRLRAGLLGTLCAAVVIGAVLVLPTLANETDEEPTTEFVAEEDLQPTETPEATEEPIETQNPNTPEPTASPDGEDAQAGEEETGDGEETDGKESEEDQPEQSPETETPRAETALPAETPKAPAKENASNPRSYVSSKRSSAGIRKRVAPEKLEKPSFEVTGEATGKYTYPLSQTIKISIKATGPEGAGIDYQWYMSRTPKGEGVQLQENGALTNTYTVPLGLDAGDYYYYCLIKSVDNDNIKLDSDVARTSDIVVHIDKGEPKLDDFDVSSLQNEYYYTGDVIDPVIVSSREGMGKAYIVMKDGDTENRPKAESEESFPIYLHVSEGRNYTAKTLDLNKRIRIRRIAAPSRAYTIRGTKGKLVNGKQWYTSAVSIVPASGYSISTTESDFRNELVYDADGRDQGPARAVVFLRSNSSKAITSAVTVTEKRDSMINIDTKGPEASLTYNDDNVTDHITNSPLVFELSASDDTSGVAKRYYYKSKQSLSESQLKGVSWKEWQEGEPVTETEEGTFIFYARVDDEAGIISYASTEQLTIDTTSPVITCNGKKLDEEKTYVADKKTIIVSDANLKRVTVKRDGGPVTDDKSGEDIVDGSVRIVLAGPAEMTPDTSYEITALDAAGNQKVTKITLKNPLLDVDADDLLFGSGDSALEYGYGQVEPQEVVLKVKGTDEKVPVSSVEIEAGDDAFEIVPGTNAVRPKQGLHTGTHEAVLRIQYNEQEESVTSCRCYVTVKKAKMLVRYTGQQDVGYHTYPDLANTIEFAPEDFKNGDTIDSLEEDTGFVMPLLYYQDADEIWQEYTSDMRALESRRLIPGNGRSTDYEFEYEAGDLVVQRHPIRHGYTIEGQNAGSGFDWYISPSVTISSVNGYYISRTDDEASFYTSDQKIFVSGPTAETKEQFYVMDASTGEISSLHTETIRIDNTAPYFREGEGITVSNDLFSQLLHDITFGVFFNDTKEVLITATDEESGLKSIEYCVSAQNVDAGSMDQLEWKPYEGGFSLSPEEYDRAVIYAKITNGAGLVTYISSNGMVFDNKQPDISMVEKGRKQGIIDEKEYITEELELNVSDRNLKAVTLFDGTNTAVTGSALEITGDGDSEKEAVRKISCPKKGSRTYTVVASDEAGNNTEREFTVTKPVYDIKADTLRIKPAVYGYEASPQTAVTWKNGEAANADASLAEVILGNSRYFEVKQEGDRFWIAAKPDLESGNYSTDVTLVYNENQRVETTCSFTVEKATLTAVYMGDDLHYHEKIKNADVKVTGFVKHKGVLETPETASGYQEPTVPCGDRAWQTCELTPAGGKADNYRFVYRSGLLLVERRYTSAGRDGQYVVESDVSDSGWHTSDIVIKPKDGYALLLSEEDAEPQESIVLSDDTDRGEKEFYVMDANTGEIYYPSTIYYKKDSTLPKIEGVEDGESYKANDKEVTVEDDYLTSVTVNGEAMPVEHGRTKFTLSATQETMVYVIVATDCAGNVSDKTIVMNQPDSLPAVSDEPGGTDEPDDTGAPLPTPSPAADGGTSKEGTIKKLVKVVEGAPNTSLTTSVSELKTSVLTGGEQQAVGAGSDANIELRIRNIDSSVPQADKELIIANLNGYSVGEYLDITLWKKVGSSSSKKVTDIRKPISITVSVPQMLRSGSRKFAVLRVHNGSVSVLPDRDSAANTVTFATDKFSTYVLAYTQGSGNGSGANGFGNYAGTAGNALYSDVSPELGDQAPLLPAAAAFVVSLAGILAVMLMRRRAGR